MSYMEIIKLIPFSLITNFLLFFVALFAMKMNPAKPTWRDFLNFIKGKYYKNPSIHRLISSDGSETEHVLPKVEETITHKVGDVERTFMMNHSLTTRRNKIPVYTHIDSLAEGVNFFNKENAKKLNSEIFENTLAAAKASADFDFFQKMWGYRHVVKFISVIAIASAAAAFFGFQILNQMNTLPICVMPGNVL